MNKYQESMKLNHWITLLLTNVGKEDSWVMFETTTGNTKVDEDHLWNFENNTYFIVEPEMFVMRVYDNGEVKYVERYPNGCTRSDFGQFDRYKEFVVKEVPYKDL